MKKIIIKAALQFHGMSVSFELPNPHCFSACQGKNFFD